MIIRKKTAKDAVISYLYQRDTWVYVTDIIKTKRIVASTVYEALEELERAGLIESKWNEEPKVTTNRRRMYRRIGRVR